MNYREEILKIRKQRGVSVRKLSEITQIPVDRIYKWESGVGNPKAEDSEKLQEWVESPDLVKEGEVEYSKQGDSQSEIILRFLDQQAILVQTNAKLAATNADLVSKILNSNESGQVSSPSQEASKGNRADLAVLPLSGKIKAESPGEKKEKQKGILKSADK